MAQGEGVGVHNDNAAPAFPAEGTQILAIALQSPAVFHQDSLGRLRQQFEPHAFENGLVLRLGENLEIMHPPGRCLGNEAGHQRSRQTLRTGFGRNCYAFDDVFGKTASCQNMAVGI